MKSLPEEIDNRLFQKELLCFCSTDITLVIVGGFSSCHLREVSILRLYL